MNKQMKGYYKLNPGKKQWEVLLSPHPFLRQKITQNITFPLSSEVEDLIFMTGNTLKGNLGIFSNRTVGISGSQVGIPYRFFVLVNFKDYMPRFKLTYVLNPVILKYSNNWSKNEELCLSLPEISAFVNRPASIDVQYNNLKGDIIKRTLTGLESIAFQHEYDHLEGILMEDKVESPNDKKIHQEYLEYIAKQLPN